MAPAINASQHTVKIAEDRTLLAEPINYRSIHASVHCVDVVCILFCQVGRYDIRLRTSRADPFETRRDGAKTGITLVCKSDCRTQGRRLLAVFER